MDNMSSTAQRVLLITGGNRTDVCSVGLIVSLLIRQAWCRDRFEFVADEGLKGLPHFPNSLMLLQRVRILTPDTSCTGMELV